jgi:four helix bundle protein
LQELDETLYWLELIKETGLFDELRLIPLMKETDELIAIFTSTVKNVKSKKH